MIRCCIDACLLGGFAVGCLLCKGLFNCLVDLLVLLLRVGFVNWLGAYFDLGLLIDFGIIACT